VVERDRFTRRQGGIDEQPGLAKIGLRHGHCSNQRRFLAQKPAFGGIIDFRRGATPRCCQNPRVVKHWQES
jgi:hypothetical protein